MRKRDCESPFAEESGQHIADNKFSEFFFVRAMPCVREHCILTQRTKLAFGVIVHIVIERIVSFNANGRISTFRFSIS